MSVTKQQRILGYVALLTQRKLNSYLIMTAYILLIWILLFHKECFGAYVYQ